MGNHQVRSCKKEEKKTTHLLNQLDKHQLAPSMGSKQLNLLRLTLQIALKAKLLHGPIDRLLRHRSVRRPFPAGNRQEATFGDVDHVVPHKRLGVLGVGVLDERTETGPGGENVASTDLDLGSEVVLDLWRTQHRKEKMKRKKRDQRKVFAKADISMRY